MSDVSKTLTVFTFQGHELRVIDHNGEPWFIGNEVCDALDIANSRDALARLSPQQRDDVGIPDAIGRIQQTNIVSEGGVYKLAFRSHKKEAEEFTDKVVNEILPSIRKTGSYGIQPLAGGLAPDVLDDPRRLMLAIRGTKALEVYLQTEMALRYPERIRFSTKRIRGPKEVEEHILHVLRRHGPISLNTLHHSYMKRWDAEAIERIINTLLDAGQIIRLQTERGWIKYAVA